MKILSVTANNRLRAFEVSTGRRTLTYPYARIWPRPSTADPVATVRVDPKSGGERFLFALRSGGKGTVGLEEVLGYHRDPGLMRDVLLLKLTSVASRCVEEGGLSKREIVRRLGTSAAQLYRLLDPENYRKSVDQMLRLLCVLGCEADIVVREREP